MEREFKERLVGAVILVAAAVLVIPGILDGPADRSAVETRAVDLPGSGNAGADEPTLLTHTIDLRPQASAAVPAPQPAPARPAPARPAAQTARAAEAPSPASDSPAAGWDVQVGSFSSSENADRLAASLREKGYTVYVSPHRAQGRVLHRVRVGPERERDSAQALAERLQRESGQAGRVVPHE